jgi:peptide-methionine (S)-S-oxide reductase
MKKIFLSYLGLIVLSFFSISFAEEEAMKQNPATQGEAIFAMGCFWCGAAAFTDHDTNEKFPGIISVRAGYTGGASTNPTYPAHEGHQEAVKVAFDPETISYEELLEIFWHNIDPFDDKGQFCDKGKTYTSTIYFKDDGQKKKALDSKKAVERRLGKPIVTEIKAASPFYDAEDYHQDYKSKNPIRYAGYRWSCGRDKRLKEIWG